MFGLEGCGFVLSLSVTFLLVGLVVYLFKQQLKTLEQKFAAIFQLSQTLATSVETLRHNYPGTGGNPPAMNDTRPEVVLSESESETESEDEGGFCPFPNVKIVDLETEPLKEHMLKVFNFNNSEMDKILDVTEMGSNDTPEMNVQDLPGVTPTYEEADDTDSDEDDSDEEEVEPGSPNYKGMKVPDLRKLVHTKNIATDQSLKNLKKHELIKLLKKNN